MLHSQFKMLWGCWKSQKKYSRSRGWAKVCEEISAGSPHLSGTTRCYPLASHRRQKPAQLHGEGSRWFLLETWLSLARLVGEQLSSHSKNGVWVGGCYWGGASLQPLVILAPTSFKRSLLLSNQLVSKSGWERAWSILGGCSGQENIAKLQHCHFLSCPWTF